MTGAPVDQPWRVTAVSRARPNGAVRWHRSNYPRVTGWLIESACPFAGRLWVSANNAATDFNRPGLGAPLKDVHKLFELNAFSSSALLQLAGTAIKKTAAPPL